MPRKLLEKCEKKFRKKSGHTYGSNTYSYLAPRFFYIKIDVKMYIRNIHWTLRNSYKFSLWFFIYCVKFMCEICLIYLSFPFDTCFLLVSFQPYLTVTHLKQFSPINLLSINTINQLMFQFFNQFPEWSVGLRFLGTEKSNIGA